MKLPPGDAIPDLFGSEEQQTAIPLGFGAVLLRGFAFAEASSLLDMVRLITLQAPFRRMVTPGGFKMSVAMTNCGYAGWVTDCACYRYDKNDPISGLPWPEMPAIFFDVARRAASSAGYTGFVPVACLINRYMPGARQMTSKHRSFRFRWDCRQHYFLVAFSV